MTGEELERAIDFLLKSQANLEARIEQVNTNLSERIEEVNTNLSARIEQTSQQLGAFADTQAEFIRVVTRTFETQGEFNRRTDERLNALIATAERLLDERRGGEAQV
jgi:ABC-type transporter Mla subunit MlaD